MEWVDVKCSVKGHMKCCFIINDLLTIYNMLHFSMHIVKCNCSFELGPVYACGATEIAYNTLQSVEILRCQVSRNL